ncbi:MAG: hypothetical protein RL322_1355 [Pseudomonadota bacterium]|jgi:LysR family nitrogen assimilation transcriptional regulator
MEFRALRYFVAVADAGSFTAASAAIHIAQPALTRQLRELERELGVQLLIRLPRGVRLTPAGVTLYQSAQIMLAESARVRQVLARGRNDHDGAVTLGASPTLTRILLPGIFERCLQTVGGLQLRAREAFTPQLLDWLDKGLIDMAIVTNPPPSRSLSLAPLVGEPFALVSHPSMKIERIVPARRLSDFPLLMTALHRRLVESQLAPLGIKLEIRAEIDSVDSIREMILKGSWATLMPISVFKEPSVARAVRISEVSGVQLNRLLVLASRHGSLDNPSRLALREIIENACNELAARGLFSITR